MYILHVQPHTFAPAHFKRSAVTRGPGIRQQGLDRQAAGRADASVGAGLSQAGAGLLGEGVLGLVGRRRRAPAAAAPRSLRRLQTNLLGFGVVPVHHGLHPVLAAAGGPAVRQCHRGAARGAIPQEQ